MHTVVLSQNYEVGNFSLLQDEQFFLWRFNNNKGKYIFYYHRKNGMTTGYVVIGVSQNNRRGYILDYAENDGVAIKMILLHLINKNHFDIISIYNYALNDKLLPILNHLGFKKNSLLGIIEKRINGELPLLIRPVKREYAEGDFFVSGLDIRESKNWCIKPIFSDYA